MKLDSYETWTEHVPLTRPYTVAYERIESVELDFVRVRAGAWPGTAAPVAAVAQ